MSSLTPQVHAEMSELVATVITGVAGEVFSAVAVPKIVKRASVAKEELERLFWFMTDGRCTAILAWKHPQLEKQLVSDDQQALAGLVDAMEHKSFSSSLKSIFGHSDFERLVAGATMEPTGIEDLSGNLLLIGGPVSNSFSKQTFEYWRTRGLPINFRIDNEAERDRVRRTIYVMENGVPTRKTIETPNWSLTLQEGTNEKPIEPPSFDESKYLRYDYLLISVLPNFHRSGRGAGRSAIAIIAGTSGIGTRAIGTALADRNLMRGVVERIGGSTIKRRYYQCLLKVEIRYREVEPGRPDAIPTKVHLARAVGFGLKGGMLATSKSG